MKWSELCIHTTNEAIEPISNILHENGASGLVIEDALDLEREHTSIYGEIYELNPEEYPEEGVYIKAYLPINSFLGETVEEIKQAINNLMLYDIDLGRNQITLSEVHEEEWATAWKKYYKPVKISKRITITPTWEDYQSVDTDEIIIELDPGMAFGTGTHPTTVLSIQALEQFLHKNDTVIDVGSGSGVLSIAAALLGATRVYAYDLDDVAVKSTVLNAKLNQLEEKIIAKQNNLLDHVKVEADLIVSNILAEVIVRFIEEAWERLKFGGYFITSGITQSKKQLVKEHLEQQGFEIIQVNELEDWVSIVALKPNQ
ncbi:50S ribosomal protein L11 methyltransferase [Virgibacillus pantothenticus]|uniref:50S ribosomal protein L11 methyltransferase n=1 Tax=Virgibacillus pantothenticus TaxID=1473 RepID=UPI001C214F0C|nr:50S ribosomal protein L11 methyltransferase [Virgibacillus pantothenticus]MBU8565571.1 50S ribosomal protein L11 methyltransferase [Virgibacillus pantothenticus]MBU8599869.1 50S ribosomal protein L11 methyltransferase [Virgibacillus pantothenticus]MBU8634316.1 50S ribosomal protein L11 methyltransferase [Virgibacillus pantothenticus]MBU8641612.1 50S ribosomal protein L11 methyltransferase [Virgibacillus pantothenticus]MBU8647846.1 50S ribosomal protein L11 methyltransferase [Virgibacillus p